MRVHLGYILGYMLTLSEFHFHHINMCKHGLLFGSFGNMLTWRYASLQYVPKPRIKQTITIVAWSYMRYVRRTVPLYCIAGQRARDRLRNTRATVRDAIISIIYSAYYIPAMLPTDLKHTYTYLSMSELTKPTKNT